MSTAEVLRQRLRPLKIRHFRALFFAQGVSLVGSWMQELAKSWIVLKLVGTASSMGALMFAAALPNLLLGSFGGVFADRRGARKTLVVTQVAFATLAFALGLLVSTGNVRFWHLLVFAAMEGCILSFDMPAFNLVTPQLVPREDFQQALALNAVNFHLSRVLGPSLAGLIMGLGGAQLVFWANAVSFMGVVIVISRLPLRDDLAGPTKSGGAGMGEVVKYLRSHPVFRLIMAQFLLLITLVFPLIFTTLRVLVQKRFNLDARTFGLVFAGPGFGALMGSLIFLVTSPKNPLKVLPIGVVGISAMLVAIAESQSLSLTVASMVVFSTSVFLCLSALLVTVQLQTEDRIRGRVSALVGMGFAAISPIMSVPIGFLSDAMGARRLLWVVSVAFLLGSTALWASSRRQGGERLAA